MPIAECARDLSSYRTLAFGPGAETDIEQLGWLQLEAVFGRSVGHPALPSHP